MSDDLRRLTGMLGTDGPWSVTERGVYGIIRQIWRREKLMLFAIEGFADIWLLKKRVDFDKGATIA